MIRLANFGGPAGCHESFLCINSLCGVHLASVGTAFLPGTLQLILMVPEVTKKRSLTAVTDAIMLSVCHEMLFLLSVKQPQEVYTGVA